MPHRSLVLAIAAAAAAGSIVLLSRGAPPGPGRAAPSSPPADAPLAMTALAPLPAASAVPAAASASPDPDPLASLPPEDAEWVLDLVARAEKVRALDPQERRELTAQLVSVRTHAVLERTEPLATPPQDAP